MATITDTPPQPMSTQNGSETGIEQFKERLNTLIQKAVNQEAESVFNWPKGEFEGVGALEWAPGVWDILFTYTPEGASDDKMVEVHMYPAQNPRDMYDEAKDAALKPDNWGEIAGWTENPDGYPNRNEYDDIRLCGCEEKSPHRVRWVQQTPGSPGGYYVRLETSYMAPKDYMLQFSEGLWNIINQVGYFNPG